jgi:NitT/TauT family transport system substrate-binding protein
MADHVLNGVIAPRRGAASRRAGYDVWRELDPEDSLRFYALWLHEFGQLESTPNALIAEGTDWRFLNELKRELKA